MCINNIEIFFCNFIISLHLYKISKKTYGGTLKIFNIFKKKRQKVLQFKSKFYLK